MLKTVSFLKKIKANNNRDWFEKNKNSYLEAKEEHEIFIDKIIKGVAKFDKKISPDMKAKDCVFRIYKDVRFSKDKTPYKNNFGASINPGGKKSLVAGYYLHIEPGASFLAGGVYMPEAEMLNAIRQEIDYNPDPFFKILNSISFKKYFKGLDDEGKLKTAPKGFDKEHPHLEILKNKHFLVSYPLSDKQLNEKDIEKTIVAGFRAMNPFLEYLRIATS
ncbi:DUF2461 domain-containing protein [Aurantibacillus circumpalustris]|uniref:DUF2461 domain-containing protein n=1 Tax=Aurantibacillus circumpalustris TaxID=3036359 RepID=UPI00295AA340|nr:DUF2461 domain-containing protein [Aurantibacillus circumpalustris]